jgi:CBS domain containing-hemolysin-like protein
MILEVVLGVDNLVFIAILADRVEPRLRDRVRVVGLGLALILRIILLIAVFWLSKPTASIIGGFSLRDIIFILGGLFLLYKATTELHERLEGVPQEVRGQRSFSYFWPAVAQIMVLDAVFSLDAVITAVGMVEHLGHISIAIVAVSIAISLMLLASRPLTTFVNAHPTVVVLCLSFLLLIGFSLVAEGFGFHVPKEYIYAAIGFSVVIEIFNQIAQSNYRKHQSKRSRRVRTTEAILRLMGDKYGLESAPEPGGNEGQPGEARSMAGEESNMISGVLSLGGRSLRSLMTPHNEIRWVDIEDSSEDIRAGILRDPHGYYPVCRGKLDELLGVGRGTDILEALRAEGGLEAFAGLRAPAVAPESMDAIRLLKLMRQASAHMVIAVDEFGSISGLITPVDVFEIIAGEFRDEDEKPDIVELEDWSLLVQGHADLHLLEQQLDTEDLLPPDSDYGTVAGLLLDRFGHLPERGEVLEYAGLRFVVDKVSDRRIEEVLISRRIAPERTGG